MSPAPAEILPLARLGLQIDLIIVCGLLPTHMTWLWLRSWWRRRVETDILVAGILILLAFIGWAMNLVAAAMFGYVTVDLTTVRDWANGIGWVGMHVMVAMAAGITYRLPERLKRIFKMQPSERMTLEEFEQWLETNADTPLGRHLAGLKEADPTEVQAALKQIKALAWIGWVAPPPKEDDDDGA